MEKTLFNDIFEEISIKMTKKLELVMHTYVQC